MFTPSDSAHMWSSSEKSRPVLPLWRCSSRRASDSLSSSIRSSFSAAYASSTLLTSPSSVSMSLARASSSIQVTIEAAKYRTFSSSLGAMSSR